MDQFEHNHVSFLRRAIIVLNFFAVLLNATIYLFSTKYIIAHGLSHSLLENLSAIPSAPEKIFFESLLLFALLLSVIYMREYSTAKAIFYDWLAYLEIILMIVLVLVLNGSYNGIILLVFMDLLYNTKNTKHWLILLSFGFALLLVSNYELMSMFIKMPSLDTYISFYPAGTKAMLLFFKNFCSSLNMVLFIIFLVSYLFYQRQEKVQVEEELALAAQVNDELKNYAALSEKIATDNERKRIAREIHDTLGHALTGISAGVDACITLIDIDPATAKSQLQAVSDVVREGIKDVRRSLNKLRPGALEDRTLKDALVKMIDEYQNLSKLHINLYYEWDRVDLENIKEDLIFRIIQESITNSLRHGHASEVDIDMFNTDDKYFIVIQDNGQGCETINYGYGLKQMSERVSILGGKITFHNANGFRTMIEIPKGKGEDL